MLWFDPSDGPPPRYVLGDAGLELLALEDDLESLQELTGV